MRQYTDQIFIFTQVDIPQARTCDGEYFDLVSFLSLDVIMDDESNLLSL